MRVANRRAENSKWRQTRLQASKHAGQNGRTHGKGAGKAVLAAAAFLVSACSQQPETAPTFHAEENPERLSEWGMIAATDGALKLSEGVTPYDLATPLFSDYALKLRTVWTPDGKPAVYNANEAFDFPVGTVITKTFYYPTPENAWTGDVQQGQERGLHGRRMALDHLRLIETRVLVRREAGWDALPYVWNEDQSDAVLKRTGAVIPMTLTRDNGEMEPFAYLVPNANQCAGCHATNATTKAIQPIGPKARHLNKPSSFMDGFNQLDHWLAKGLLTFDGSSPHPEEARSAIAKDEGSALQNNENFQFPRNADWTDETAPLAARARAYLDANCSHCHNPNGPADTSGLDLEPGASGPAMGHCKAPIAAGRGTGGRPYDIVPGRPDLSITVFRMETTDPGAMMPELGRAVRHEEGVELVREWIAAMDGGCG
ncbi:SO2930 family diheme c-type cytochrome [Hyphococcus sp.]|uniref:SO2930 family diheme c-type cytochrome n=1 Tax=Hyphococcus sp. TaxID=2038636 RepID=UPI0035C6C314